MTKIKFIRTCDKEIVPIKIIRFATREDGYGRGFRLVEYQSYGHAVSQFVHKSMILNQNGK